MQIIVILSDAFLAFPGFGIQFFGSTEEFLMIILTYTNLSHLLYEFTYQTLKGCWKKLMDGGIGLWTIFKNFLWEKKKKKKKIIF